MSADQIAGPAPLPTFHVDRPIDDAPAFNTAPQAASLQAVGRRLPRSVAGPDVATDTVEELLLSVARGRQEAFVALQSRMAGLVRVNVRRLLRDASRSEAVTQETFAEVLEDAIHFDPHRDSGQTWLLARAHRHAVAGLHSIGAENPRRPSGHSSFVGMTKG